MTTIQLAFLGAGNMAEAIARGILGAKVLAPDAMIAADPAQGRRDLFRSALGIATVEDNEAVVISAPVVLVAVKPQTFDKAIGPLGSRFGPEKLIVSICAGISTAHVEQCVAPGTRVVRAMPNTPMLVGRGMCGICRGSCATDADLATASQLLGAAAEILRVPENLMDAVTAVSGSGPAYFFYLAELLAKAGAELGLQEDDARRLARVTFEGAARLMAQSNEEPDALRRKVTSPGGTTEAALKAFDALGLPKVISEGVKAARDRGRELGR